MNKPASTQTSKAVGLAQEIELKLDVGPGPIQPLLDLSLWANQTTANLSAVYFDTPELTLYRAGLSLRVRQGVQTLKVTNRPASKAMMGLFDRAEWEHPLEGQTPDLSLLCGTPGD